MFRPLVIAAALALLAVPTADAASMRVEGGVLKFDAAAGESNWVSLQESSGKVFVSGDMVAVGAGCSDATYYPSCTGVTSVEMMLGDRDDGITIHAPFSLPVSIEGGAGDDSADLGNLADHVFDGGAGQDTARFWGRPGGLEIQLGATPLVKGRDATVHPRDTLVSVETASGTEHDDVIVGASGATRHNGGKGDDRIDVRDGAGDDWVYCEDGEDTAIVDLYDSTMNCEKVDRPSPPVLPPTPIKPGPPISPISPIGPIGPIVPVPVPTPIAVDDDGSDDGQYGNVYMTRTASLVVSTANQGGRSVGFLKPPALEGNALVAALQGPAKSTITIRWEATSWGGGAPVALDPVSGAVSQEEEVELNGDDEDLSATADSKQVTARAAGVVKRDPTAWVDNQVTLRAELPAAIRERFAREGRLRLKAHVSVKTIHGKTAQGTGELVAATVPVAPDVRGGRTYSGDFGPERINGTGRGDRLSGRSGNDRLHGLGAADILNGGTGNDRLEGGDGNDRSDGYDGDDMHFGGPGDDQLIEERFGDDILDGGPGDDVLVGGRGNDVLYGGPGDDVLWGGTGPDRIECGEGEDIAFVNFDFEKRSLRGCEHVFEEGSVRTIECNDKGNRNAGEGAELLLGTEGNDKCSGGGGDDDVEGRGGNDVLEGARGNDRVFGRFGDDWLYGGLGDDEMEGGRGKDRLEGGPGNDELNGGLDDDVVKGGSGDDKILARGGGRDSVDCGPGRDVVYIDSSDRVRNCEAVIRTLRKKRR